MAQQSSLRPRRNAKVTRAGDPEMLQTHGAKNDPPTEGLVRPLPPTYPSPFPPHGLRLPPPRPLPASVPAFFSRPLLCVPSTLRALAPSLFFSVTPKVVPNLLAMTVVVAFSSCLDVAAIEMEMGTPLDFNGELGTVCFIVVPSGCPAVRRCFVGLCPSSLGCYW